MNNHQLLFRRGKQALKGRCGYRAKLDVGAKKDLDNGINPVKSLE